MALAKIIFDEIVFNKHGSSAGDCISLDDDDKMHSHHPYDTPENRDDFWMNRGIGINSVRAVGCVRNALTNICRDETSE
jgi:hypothetical protein